MQVLNLVVVFCHLRLFKPLLFFSLKNELGSKLIDLQVRNSILTMEYFHFFYSDVDLSLILVDCDFDHLTKVRKILAKFKRFYPFMGEVEIYSQNEWLELIQLKEKNNFLYSQARVIRKYFWMGAPDDLHQSPKRLRALRVILKKLGIGDGQPYSDLVAQKLIELTRRHVQIEMIEGENSYFHTYFTCSFLAPTDYLNHGISLSAFDLIAIASLFPTDNEDSNGNKILIEKIRNNQQSVKTKWYELKRIDQLEIRASQRGRI
jgi:hypothetical protein